MLWSKQFKRAEIGSSVGNCSALRECLPGQWDRGRVLGVKAAFPLWADSHSSSVLAAWLAVGVLCPLVSSAALYFVGIGTILPQLSSRRVLGAWLWWSLWQVLPNLCLYRLQGVVKMSQQPGYHSCLPASKDLCTSYDTPPGPEQKKKPSCLRPHSPEESCWLLLVQAKHFLLPSCRSARDWEEEGAAQRPPTGTLCWWVPRTSHPSGSRRCSRSWPSLIRVCQGCQGNCLRQSVCCLSPLCCVLLDISLCSSRKKIGKVPQQEEAGIWLNRLGSGGRHLSLHVLIRAFLERGCECTCMCECVYSPVCVPVGGVSGRGLLLGGGELWGLSCQGAGSICQLFAHCLPIGDPLQVLKWTGSLGTCSFLGAAIT